jgi:hypothetical protein
MNPWQSFWSGIAPDHAAALIITVLAAGLWLLLGRNRIATIPLPITQRWAFAGLAITGVLHAALPVGHHDNPWLTAGFLVAGAGYLWLASRVWQHRSWRLLTTLLVLANLVGYLIVVTAGGEEPDQVGIATALDELLVLAIALTGPATRRFARAASSAGIIASIMIVGTTIWIGSFVAHQASDLDADLSAGGSPLAASHHDHEHDHAARAQAGIIMRPLADHHPTAAQIQAAEQLATATKETVARFADIHTALAAGYQLSGIASGTEVHLENQADKNNSSHILDPAHPQALVYVIADGKASLLGAVYRMPFAGRPGPTPAAAITRWHAHNICLTALPPGAGLASPFGGCPALSVSVTMPEMMHVWTVDNPGGPYAEGIDQKWALAYNIAHGTPYPG